VLSSEAKMTLRNIPTLEHARHQDFTTERGPENSRKDLSLRHVTQFLLKALQHLGYKNISFRYLFYNKFTAR
jgi:hypothetical protein